MCTINEENSFSFKAFLLLFFFLVSVYFPTRFKKSIVISFLQINSDWKQT